MAAWVGSNSIARLFLTFNERAMLTTDLGGSTPPAEDVDCSAIFSQQTLNLRLVGMALSSKTLRLGARPGCKWLADGRNLQVSLGTDPTLTYSTLG